MEEGEGVKYKHSISFSLKKNHHKKFLKHEGFNLSHEDLKNTEYPDKVTLNNVHPSFHKRYRHATKHDKGLKISKKDYEEHFGLGIKEEKKEHHKKNHKVQKEHSNYTVTKNLHIPNGQLLKGVQIETGQGYQLPLSSDVHTMATKIRIKKQHS